MDGIQADKGAAALGDLPDQLGQIAEVTDPPVMRGAQGIQLYAGAPELSASQQGIRLMAARRCNNDPALPLLLPIAELQAVVAQRQVVRQRQMFTPAQSTLIGRLGVVFQRERPLVVAPLTQGDNRRTSLPGHQDGR